MIKFPPYETDKNGLNKKIQCHVLPDELMRKYHFTDLSGSRWYYTKNIRLPLRHYGTCISFNLLIDKDGSAWRIDVLDEYFLQPYDYQSMIDGVEEPNEMPMIVFKGVEKIMADLASKGIISGHEYGEYI